MRGLNHKNAEFSSNSHRILIEFSSNILIEFSSNILIEYSHRILGIIVFYTPHLRLRNSYDSTIT